MARADAPPTAPSPSSGPDVPGEDLTSLRSSRSRTRTVALGVGVALVVVAAAAAVTPAVTGAGDRAGAPRLIDATAASGLDWTHGAFRWGVSGDPTAMMGGGACWLDADGDGQMDVYLVSTYAQDEHARWTAEGGLPTSTLWRNTGGTFRDVGAESGTAIAVRGQGCLAADLDGDGHTDLYVTTDRANVLLWNDGDGTFTADDGAAGLDVYGWHTSASAGDVDGDGRLDVFVGGYLDPNAPLEGAAGGFPRSHRPVRDLLLRNTGPHDGARAVFELVEDGGIDPDGPRYTLGSSLTDVDRDGDLDLVVANDTDPNRLYRNDSTPGEVVLVDVARPAGADDDGSGMGVATGDLDGDRRDDLVVTNLGSQGHALLVGGAGASSAEVAFADGRAALGAPAFGDGLTGWGTTMTDLDGDGGLEVLVGNGAIPVIDLAEDARPLRAWSASDGELVDATARLGLDDVAPRNARAVAVADADGDADPDVLVTSIGGPATLLRTVGADGAGWVVVDPEGRVPGTVVELTLPDGRVLRRELRAGSSYLSTEDPRALFGTGPSERVPQVVVRWPDGATATVGDVAPGGVVTVERPS